MSFDGNDEVEAILTRLKTLVGGRVFEGVPSDAQLTYFDSERTTVKPYIVFQAGEPIPAARGRGVAGSEAGQPHILPVSITSIAGDGKNCRLTAGAVNRKVIGWAPNTPNSGEIKGRGGQAWVTLDAQLVPSRFFRSRNAEVLINLTPAADPVA